MKNTIRGQNSFHTGGREYPLRTARFDVVVVGGGPAGAAAARTVAAGGLKVCVVDKHVFPRNKLCGGLLTLRSKKIFHQVFQTSWDPVIEVISRGVRFFYKERFLNSLHDYKDIYFTNRYKFDEHLLGLAVEAGASLHLGTAVRNINIEGYSVQLENGTTLTSEYIIGADGVNSSVSKSLFGITFNRNKIGFGLEMEVPTKGGYTSIEIPEIYFGVAKWGYGWVFPKQETLTVGIGGLCAKNADLKGDFNRFLTMRFGHIPNEEIKGHYIPFGNYRRQPGKNNVLLCGDAAGLVEPITGEGIAFAMQSGYYAALSIIEALSKKRGVDALELYKEKYRNITNALNHAYLLRYLIFPKLCECAFITILPKTQSVPRKHMDLMAADIGYGEYVQFLVAKIAKGILKRVFPLGRTLA